MLSSVDLLYQKVLQTILDELPVDQHDMSVVLWLKLQLHKYDKKGRKNNDYE